MGPRTALLTLLAAALVGALILWLEHSDAIESGTARWNLPLQERSGDPFPRALPGATLLAEPRQIIAGSVTATEVCFALGLTDRVCAVHEIATDPRYCVDAPLAMAFPRKCSADPEHMLAMQPDLVITDPFTASNTQALLERSSIPVLRTVAVDSLDDVLEDLRRIGYASGRDTAAERLILELEARLDRVARNVSGRKPLRVLHLQANLCTYGEGSLVDEIIRRAGAVNIARTKGMGSYGTVDPELILSWNPDVLLVAEETGAAGAPSWVTIHPALARLSAVIEGRVVSLPGALLNSTTFHAVDAVERVAEALGAWSR